MEEEEFYVETAKRLSKIMEGKDWYYKGSFDKANRSSVNGKRGPGLDKALKMFARVKKEIPGIRLITDVHEVYQVKKLAGLVDCIQIPAFLCRQTDLLVECGKYFDKINIKKGQWMSPDNIVHSISKVKSQNPDAEVWLTERGTAFGYDRFIVDFSSVDLFKKHFDRVILDCTHSTQYINKEGFTKGNRELAGRYLLASSVFGYTGVFAEVHPKPEDAVSDGMCMIRMDAIENILRLHDELAAVLSATGKTSARDKIAPELTVSA